MGHLLATINPGAVDQIGGTPAALPGVSGWVVYIPRPGEGRGGRGEFPALVMSRNEQAGTGTLDLLVVYDANDVIIRNGIPMTHPDHPFPAWRHPDHAKPEEFEPSRLNKVRQDLDQLKEAVLGAYVEPEGGVVKYLVEFEDQLRAARKEITRLRNLIEGQQKK